MNCFDGFACVEGTLLFITANKPEVIDNALLRSCRVDHKYELGYADEYQTKFIFEKMAPENDKQSFKKFYNLVKSKEYTTAMLQEFLFPNRKEATIFDNIEDFYSIITNNKSKVDKLLRRIQFIPVKILIAIVTINNRIKSCVKKDGITNQ